MKIIEKYYPLLVSIFFTIALYFIKVDTIENLKDIILSVITFASIIIGFLTTMVSILVTSNDKSIISYIKKNGRLKDLYIYLAVPIIVGIVLVIVCLLLLPIAEKCNLKNHIRFYMSGFTLFYFALSCIRAITLVLAIIFQFVDYDTKLNNANDENNIDLSNAFGRNEEDDFQ